MSIDSLCSIDDIELIDTITNESNKNEKHF